MKITKSTSFQVGDLVVLGEDFEFSENRGEKARIANITWMELELEVSDGSVFVIPEDLYGYELIPETKGQVEIIEKGTDFQVGDAIHLSNVFFILELRGRMIRVTQVKEFIIVGEFKDGVVELGLKSLIGSTRYRNWIEVEP